MPRWFAPLVFATILVTGFAGAQQQASPGNVDAMLRQAREDIRDFEKGGGKKDDPKHPIEHWVELLWAFHDQAPQSADAGMAASEAIHLLVHADRFAEVRTRTNRLAADDPAWTALPTVLFEAATLQKDFSWLFQKLDAVLPDVKAPKARAEIQVTLGRAWRGQNEPEKAKAAFRAAIESDHDSAPGHQADAELYDLLHLGPGEPAPTFTAKTVGASGISLADYRGKPAVLVFWSTH